MINKLNLHIANKTTKFLRSTGAVKPFQVVWGGEIVSGTWNTVTERLEQRPVWLTDESTEDLEIYLKKLDKR